MKKESDENESQKETFASMLVEFGHEAKKIRKVSQSVAFFVRQAEMQSKNVDRIAEESTNDLCEKLKLNMSGKTKRTLDGLVTGIGSVELQEKIQSMMKNQKTVDVNEMKKITEKPNRIIEKLQRPEILLTPSSVINDEEDNELMSESDSEFIPEWSSAGSFATLNSNSHSNFADDEFDVGSSADNLPLDGGINSDVWLLSDDDLDEPESMLSSSFRKNEKLREIFAVDVPYHNIPNHPTPACGRNKEAEEDKPCSSNDSTSGTSSMKQDPQKFSCHAVRRVKSMAHDIAIDKEVDNDQRQRVMKIKHMNESTMFAIPSPLLSREDISSIKRSPSQLSTKISLKRSRSNIQSSVGLGFNLKPTFRKEVIHEESEEDS